MQTVSGQTSPGPAALRRFPEHQQVAALVASAQSGDDRAWAELVRRFQPSMRWVARRYGLGSAQVDDVVQTAWLRLCEHIGDLRDARAVGAWLRVTVRREAFRVLQRHVGELLVDEPPEVIDAADEDEPMVALLVRDRRAVLSRAIAELPERHRRLMDVLVTEPDLPYHEISAHTGLPRGSIGPIRGRCLARIADHPEVRALRD